MDSSFFNSSRKLRPTRAGTTTFPTAAVQRALASSLATGTFTDTTYHLFSLRLANGNIGRSRTIYANSAILKAAGDHFIAQLSGGFATKLERTVNETDAYSYEDDSDIEDMEEDAAGETLYEMSACGSKDTKQTEKIEADEMIVPASPTPPQPVISKLPNIKHCIFVPDVAANTWQALMYYIYTGRVHFAPLRSQGLGYRTQALVKHHEQNPDLPVLCSPKSVYRLADIVGLESLKGLARADLLSKISKGNIIEELFSRISSAYPEVLDAQLALLYKDSVQLTELMPQIQKYIKLVTEGQVPHAENVLNALVGKLSLLLLSESEKASTLGVTVKYAKSGKGSGKHIGADLPVPESSSQNSLPLPLSNG